MNTFTFLYRLIRYRPGWYIATVLFWTLIHLAPIVPGLLTKAFFDELSDSSGRLWGVWGIIALLVAAGLGRVIVILGGGFTEVNTRFRASMLVRSNLLRHVLKEPGARAIPVSPGEAISHFRDDADQTEKTVSWTVDVFAMIGFSILSSFILIRTDVQLTLLVFVPLILVVAAAQMAASRLQKYRAASRQATAKVTSVISEMFTNAQAIQIAGAENRVIGRFRQLNEQRRKTMVKDKLMSDSLDSVFTHSVNLGTGFILLLAAHKMRSGSFTVGDLALFVYYLTFVTELIAGFGKFLRFYKQLSVSLSRMTSLLQGAPAQTLTEYTSLQLSERERFIQPNGNENGHEDSIKDEFIVLTGKLTTLEVRGLTYIYPENGRGIEDIDLTLNKGSFTVITGMIGSGKTTLVRALLGLLPKDRGEIRWNGELVVNPGDFFIPPRSAYTSQIPRLYSSKLKDNILLGYPEHGGNLERAIHLAVMEEDVNELPRGLDTVIGPRGVKLSGGQGQRAATARMLVRKAELYVFDDLSSALDVETEQKLWERMFRDRGEATCLVVTHRKSALMHADHIIVLNDGRIEAEGTAQSLLQESESFQKLWYAEKKGASSQQEIAE